MKNADILSKWIRMTNCHKCGELFDPKAVEPDYPKWTPIFCAKCSAFQRSIFDATVTTNSGSDNVTITYKCVR